MNPTILDKVQQYYPRLARLVENYRTRHEAAVELAIIDAVLTSDNRWFGRDEILYLARLKANADSRMRNAQEELELRVKHARHLQRYRPPGEPDADTDADAGDPTPLRLPASLFNQPARPSFYVVRDEETLE